MKWIIALSQTKLSEQSWPLVNSYELMALVAITSAKERAPSLEPNLIYSGIPNPFTELCEKLGVQVHYHKLSIDDAVEIAEGRSEHWKHVARGTMLRLDIPRLFQNSMETCLYTDVDVMFLDDPGRYKLETNFLAFSTEFTFDDFSQINAGVMLINIPLAAKVFPPFLRWTSENLSWIPDYDQGAIKYFFDGKWDRLDQRLNWKPYWGISNPVIVHFHGPKPTDFDAISRLPEFDETVYPVYAQLYRGNIDGYKNYLSSWYGFAFKFYSQYSRY
jgi:lipopolysaccharide biosynthesis glycosyltransferase